MQFARGHDEFRPQSTVAMDPERLMVLTTVRMTAAAGRTVLTIDVWLDRAAVARPHVRDIRSNRNHFDAKLVTRNSRIAKERHFAEVTGNVRAANADPVHPHERITRPRFSGRFNFDPTPGLWSFKLQRFHRSLRVTSGTRSSTTRWPKAPGRRFGWSTRGRAR